MQKTIIDRCVRLVYQTYLNDPRPENMPILEDLPGHIIHSRLPVCQNARVTQYNRIQRHFLPSFCFS